MPLRPLTTTLVLSFALSMALAGCGRKGELEPPAGSVAPSSAAVASPQASGTGNSVDAGSGAVVKKKKEVKITAPDRHFALDPLIQ